MLKYNNRICKLIANSMAVTLLVGCSSNLDITPKEYLKKNNSEISINNEDDFSGMKIMNDDLKNAKVILTGEMHAIDKNSKLELKIIKYLQKEIGLKYILDEAGYSNTYFINQYLETGDEEILKKSFSYVKGTVGHNQDSYDFYKDLYGFNKNLKDEDKLSVIGIDIEHNASSSYNYLLDVIEKYNISNDKLNLLLSTLKKILSGDNQIDNLQKQIQLVLSDINSNYKHYESILGKDLFGFKLVLENINTKIETDLDRTNNSDIRENQIYKNFKSIDSVLDDAKYFGQFGAYHVIQDAYKHKSFADSYIESFASKLDKDNEFKDKVISIMYSYSDKKRANNKEFSPKDELFDSYINSDSSDCILFDLNKDNSPFEKEFIWPLKSDIEVIEGSSTTDYIQYLLLIKNPNQSKYLNVE